MQYFMDTTETIPLSVGFSHYDGLHIVWLCALVVFLVVNCVWYRKMHTDGRARWRKGIAAALLADELFKVVMLFAGHRYLADYLPLHLCSINIFIITYHAFHPSKLLDNFLYLVCTPGTLAALLFPSWTSLPLGNFMHIHSFTVHILLIAYPVVLTVGGDFRLDVKWIGKCLGFLIVMAIPIYGINLLLDTNFMFLMYAEKGNPLYWFGQNWGSHLWGFPVIICGVVIVMYLPVLLMRRFGRK